MRPQALDLEENNAEASSMEEVLPPSPVKTSGDEPASPSPMLSPMSRFVKMNEHLEGHVAAATEANRSAKKLSAAASNALGAFMRGAADHAKEANLCHVAQEILRGARLMQVQRMREHILQFPEYAPFSGLGPKPKGDEFKVDIVMDPYGRNERVVGIVSMSTSLGEIYEKYPIKGYKFDRVGIMVHGMQAPVGYRSFQLAEFECHKDIDVIFICPMKAKWQKDKVLDSPSHHAYSRLDHDWYEKK